MYASKENDASDHNLFRLPSLYVSHNPRQSLTLSSSRNYTIMKYVLGIELKNTTNTISTWLYTQTHSIRFIHAYYHMMAVFNNQLWHLSKIRASSMLTKISILENNRSISCQWMEHNFTIEVKVSVYQSLMQREREREMKYNRFLTPKRELLLHADNPNYRFNTVLVYLLALTACVYNYCV